MLVSLIHTMAEVGLILIIAHLLAMKYAGTPLGAALSFTFGSGT